MPFVSLRLVLWNAHPNERANQTADRAAHSEAGKSGHNRTGCNKRTDSGNRKSADPSQQAKSSTNRSTCSNAGSGTFWRLCILLMSKIFGALVFREQNRDIVTGEVGGQQVVDASLCLISSLVNPKHRYVFFCHDLILPKMLIECAYFWHLEEMHTCHILHLDAQSANHG